MPFLIAVGVLLLVALIATWGHSCSDNTADVAFPILLLITAAVTAASKVSQ